MMEVLVQLHGETDQHEKRLEVSGEMPRWGGMMKANGGGCFYCGNEGHFIPECCEMKADVEGGWVNLDSAGKLRLADGSYIPNMPNAPTLRERVERYICCQTLIPILLSISLSLRCRRSHRSRDILGASIRLYVLAPETSSPCFYERAAGNDLDPDLTDLLEVQFERWMISIRSCFLHLFSYPTSLSIFFYRGSSQPDFPK
jgi:hypothetical protein